MIVIQFEGLAGMAVETIDIEPGAYLAEYDVDAHGGRGSARWTIDFEAALKFDDVAAAHAAWSKQSQVRPLRADGQPNRPLTAFSVSMTKVDR